MHRIKAFLILGLTALAVALGCPVLYAQQGEAERTHAGHQERSSGRARLVVQLSHANFVSAMALSRGGRLLASAAWDNTLRLWDARTAQELRRLEGHTGVVRAMAWSPDGRYLVTGGEDKTARVWDASTGAEVLTLAGHAGAVRAVDVSPDGAVLASGSDDMSVRLWDRRRGVLIRTLKGFPSEISSLVFSPDGGRILVASHDSAQLRDTKDGGELVRFAGHLGGVSSVAISPDGHQVLTGSLDRTARLWRADTGRELRRLVGHKKAVTAVAFARDGRFAVTGSKDGTARIWDVSQTREPRVLDLEGHPTVSAVALSPDGDTVFIAVEKTVQSWDRHTKRRIHRFEGNTDLVSSVAFSPGGERILIGGWDDSGHLWDAATGMQTRRLQGHSGDVRAVAFSPDGRLALTGGRDDARLWRVDNGAEIHRFAGHEGGVRPVAFSPDGRLVVTGGDDGTAILWEAAGGFARLRSFGPHEGRVAWAAFAPDGGTLLTASEQTIHLWDVGSGRELKRLLGHSGLINSVAFSRDGRLAVSAAWDHTARLWDLASGREIPSRRLVHPDGVYTAVFSPDGRHILTGADDGIARLWDARTGKAIRRFLGHTAGIIQVAFSPDGRFMVSASADQTARLWDVSSAEELCELISFRDGGWAVVDREGRFDASNGGEVEGLHWVIGLEPIALYQLKERYYEPGLLAKKLGLNSEPIRAVQGFAEPRLFPSVSVDPVDPGDSRLRIHLKNRGGGIGRVIVSVNGKEVRADARGQGVNPNAHELTLQVPLAGNPYLIPGQENVIEVRAFNAEGYLSSRGIMRAYRPPGEAPAQRPTLWAIVAGISNYEGQGLDLRYAAKDAREMARALRIGANRLLGEEHVRITLLASGADGDALVPSKAAFEQAFAKVREAKPWDILAVYLAGHGVAVGDDYYYLTRGARSADLSDPVVRKQVAVSGSELVAWLKRSPALKQVMVLDTCAAGQAALKLVEKRDVSSSQVRAIERLKDRTGFHVLMGSAADAVSYEATQYEQGLLTFALLHGMRGPALRDEEFVDVSRLFQHAADEVPNLARHIGGIQRPRIAAPRGSSFDIGQLSAEDRRKITLHTPKPLLLHPVLLNAEALLDDLELSARLRSRLREASYSAIRGEGPPMPLVYVNAAELTGAIRPSGTYVIDGDTVRVTMVLARNGERLKRLEITGSRADIETLSEQIIERIEEAVRRVR